MSKNIYQKLLEAQIRFDELDVKKTGKNMHLSFKYYELEDIAPVAKRIFKELGLVGLVSFTGNLATMELVDTDDPTQSILFTSPMKELPGNAAMNPMQALGSVETYQRRYLYMMCLDICESDSIDSTSGTTAPAVKPSTARAVAPPTVGDKKKSGGFTFQRVALDKVSEEEMYANQVKANAEAVNPSPPTPKPKPPAADEDEIRKLSDELFGDKTWYKTVVHLASKHRTTFKNLWLDYVALYPEEAPRKNNAQVKTKQFWEVSGKQYWTTFKELTAKIEAKTGEKYVPSSVVR